MRRRSASIIAWSRSADVGRVGTGQGYALTGSRRGEKRRGAGAVLGSAGAGETKRFGDVERLLDELRSWRAVLGVEPILASGEEALEASGLDAACRLPSLRGHDRGRSRLVAAARSRTMAQ